MNPVFSSRSSWPGDKNALTLAIEALARSGASVLDLTLSNPTRAELPYDEAAIRAALCAASIAAYSPEPLGNATARQAVCDHLQERGISARSDNVLLTSGTSEAYCLLFHLFCDAGDEVLVPAPSYPLLDHLARISGVRLVQYELGYDGAWYIDFDQLACVRTARTRAVVVVNPNNPTGSCVSDDEWQRLGALGLPIVSDEVFLSYPLGATLPPSALQALTTAEAPVFVLDGLSKFAALPQLKLAWTAFSCPSAARPELIRRLELAADALLSLATPVQHALPGLLAAGALTRTAIQSRILENLAELRRRAEGTVVSVLQVDAGWYATLRLPQLAYLQTKQRARLQSELAPPSRDSCAAFNAAEGSTEIAEHNTMERSNDETSAEHSHDENTEEQLVLDLLSEQRVLVAPGYFYDFASEPHFILSLLTPPERFAEGVRRILTFVTARSGPV